MHFVDNYSVRMVESYKQPLETIKEPGYLLLHSFASKLCTTAIWLTKGVHEADRPQECCMDATEGPEGPRLSYLKIRLKIAQFCAQVTDWVSGACLWQHLQIHFM